MVVLTREGFGLEVKGDPVPISVLSAACTWIDDKQAHDGNLYLVMLMGDTPQLDITYKNGFGESLVYDEGLWCEPTS